MLYYEGHLCYHELLHRKRNDIYPNDYLDSLRKQLFDVNKIHINLSFYNVDMYKGLIEHLIEDYPQIKQVHIHKNNFGRYNDPRYFNQDAYTLSREHFESCTQDYIEPIYDFSWQDMGPRKSMSNKHFKENCEYIKNLFWTELHMTCDSLYWHIFRSINQYRPDFTQKNFISLIDIIKL